MQSLSLLALAGLAAAHFELKYPESIGNSDSTADDGPCGGFEPDVSEGSDQLVDVHVGGEAIALLLTHSRATWLFRATLNASDIDDADWRRLAPNTVQSGLGDFCLPSIKFPEDWAGERGVISVVSSAEDGQLYQCIAANFIEGSGTVPDECTNATSVTAYTTDDAQLDALVGEGSGDADDDNDDDDNDDGEDHTDHETETGEAAPEETEDSAAVSSLQMWSSGGLASFVTVVSMVLYGGALMM